MFLTLNHQKPDVYKVSTNFVLECYKLSKSLPRDEKFGMIPQIQRDALSVHLNVAEGCSRQSEAERNFKMVGTQMVKCFKIITGMTRS